MIRGALGTYTLMGELGRGGMGAVYRARHDPSGREVAIKRLLPQAAEDVELLLRFRREAEALRGIEHPHLVAVLDGQLQGPQPFVVFELVEGPDLRQRVESQGPLPWQEAVRIARDVAAGLAAAHERGLLHRDVKPENVLLAPEGAKLADFGLVKAADLDSLTRSQAGILGTPGYMAPEQAMCERNLGPAADLYGLAATLFFALTGRDPFREGSTIATLRAVIEDPPPAPREFERSVPQWLSELCRRGLAKVPGERPPSAIAFRAALLGPPRSSGRRLRSIGAVAGLAGLGIAFGAWLGESRPAAPGVAPVGSSAAPEHPAQGGQLATAPAAPVSPSAADPASASSPPDDPLAALKTLTVDSEAEMRSLIERLQEARAADVDRDALWAVVRDRYGQLTTSPVFVEDSRPLLPLLDAAVELAGLRRERLTKVALALINGPLGPVDSEAGRAVATRLGDALADTRASGEELVILATLASSQTPRPVAFVRELLRRLHDHPEFAGRIKGQAAAVALRIGDPSQALEILDDAWLAGARGDRQLVLKGLGLRLEARRALGGVGSYLDDAMKLAALDGGRERLGLHAAWAHVVGRDWEGAERALQDVLEGETLVLHGELEALECAIRQQDSQLPPPPEFVFHDRQRVLAVAGRPQKRFVAALAALGSALGPRGTPRTADDVERVAQRLSRAWAALSDLDVEQRGARANEVWRLAIRHLRTAFSVPAFFEDPRPLSPLLEELALRAGSDGPRLADLAAAILVGPDKLVRSRNAGLILDRLRGEVSELDPGRRVVLAALMVRREEDPRAIQELLQGLLDEDELSDFARVRGSELAVMMRWPRLALALLPDAWVAELPQGSRVWHDALARRLAARRFGVSSPDAYLADGLAVFKRTRQPSLDLVWATVQAGDNWPFAEDMLRRVTSLPRQGPEEDAEIEAARSAIAARSTTLPPPPERQGSFPSPSGPVMPPAVRACLSFPELVSDPSVRSFVELLREAERECDAVQGAGQVVLRERIFLEAVRRLQLQLQRVESEEQLRYLPLVAWCGSQSRSGKRLQQILGILVREAVPELLAAPEVQALADELAAAPRGNLERMLLAQLELKRARPDLAGARALLRELQPDLEDPAERTLSLGAAHLALRLRDPELALRLCDAAWLRRAGELEDDGRRLRSTALIDLRRWEEADAELNALGATAQPWRLHAQGWVDVGLGRWGAAREVLARLEGLLGARVETWGARLDALRTAIEREDPEAASRLSAPFR